MKYHFRYIQEVMKIPVKMRTWSQLAKEGRGDGKTEALVPKVEKEWLQPSLLFMINIPGVFLLKYVSYVSAFGYIYF